MKYKEKVFEVLLTPDEFYKLMFACSFVKIVFENCTSELHDKIVKYKLFDYKQMPDYDGKAVNAIKGYKTKFNLNDSISIYTGSVLLANSYNSTGLKDMSFINYNEMCNEYVSAIIQHWASIEEIHNRVTQGIIETFKDSPAFNARMDLLNTKIYNVN